MWLLKYLNSSMEALNHHLLGSTADLTMNIWLNGPNSLLTMNQDSCFLIAASDGVFSENGDD